MRSASVPRCRASTCWSRGARLPAQGRAVGQLAAALRQVHAGGRAIDPHLAAAAWGDEDPLSERERQVLRLAGEGARTVDIGQRLHLSQGTVRNCLSEAIGKLGAANRIEAYRLARAKGWL